MARPKINPSTTEKVCPICKTAFDCKWVKRKTQRYCSKVCANADPIVKKKIVKAQTKTFESKYGMHPMKTKETKKNLSDVILEKYGVDWSSKIDGFADKVKKTKFEKYGDENYNNAEQTNATCIEKYGAPTYVQSVEYLNRAKSISLIKHGVDHSSKSKQFKDSHKALMFKKFVESKRFENFIPKFSFDEYDGVTERFNKKYEFECKRCNSLHLYDLSDGNLLRCPKCDMTGISDFQTEITDYLKFLFPNDAIVVNDRTLIHPLEIDIHIPSLNIAVEANGVYYHTEVSGKKDKNYHLNKIKRCLAKGTRLLHVMDTEWNQKRDIVKSILRVNLGVPTKKIYGRECTVSIITPKQKKEFLEKNHIQGNDHASILLGLFHDKELVSIMTFVKSRFDRKIEWEMSRYCSLLGVSILGGASKLFSRFIKDYKPKSIVSYSDRRFFTGEIYLKLGFAFVNNTPPNYHYIIDSYDSVQSRINWQKAKLERKLTIFDPKQTEWQNMQNNGFDRIWDCGHSKWIWTDKNS